jgi:peptidoglycan/LPS O-acetylase OafA/YrhL
MSLFTFQKLKPYFSRPIPENKIIKPIDGLRFISILIVIITHSSSYALEYLLQDDTLKYFENGHGGVHMFFAISGFVLSQQLILNTSKFNYWSYLRRRFERIEPPLFITAAIMVILQVILFGDPKKYIESYFYVITYTSTYFQMNKLLAVYWSLDVEFAFYIFLPLFWIFFRKNTLFWIFFLLSIELFSFDVPLLPNMKFFAAGILVSILYSHKDKFSILPKENTIKNALTILLIMVLFFSRHLIMSPYFDLLESMLLFVILYLVVIQKALNSILSHSLVFRLGSACYIIYLVHYPIISGIGRIFQKMNIYGDISGYFLWIMLIFTGLFGSFLIFPLLERPFMVKKWWKFKFKDLVLHPEKIQPSTQQTGAKPQ